MQRPTGITVLAIAILVSATIRFIISFIDMALGSWLTAMAMSPGYIAPAARPAVDAIGDLGFWIGLFGMIVACVMVIAVRGLWALSKWGWWLGVAVLLVALLLNVIPMLQGTVNLRLVLQTLFDTAFLVYLFTPGVRAAFAGPHDVSAPAR
jgi:hypothetical protein